MVLNLYRPPQGSVSSFIEKLGKIISELNLVATAEIYVLGDYNIDMLDNTSKSVKDLFRELKLHGALPLIKDFTRRSTTSACLDQIFSSSDVISSSGVLDLNISNHLAVFCTRKKKVNLKGKKQFEGRSYRNYIKEDFQDQIINLDWNSFYSCIDPIDCWDIMEYNIKQVIDRMCQTKIFNVMASTDRWVTNDPANTQR